MLWIGACPSYLCRFFEKYLIAKNSNSSLIMVPSLEHTLIMGSFRFFAVISTSFSVIAAFSDRSILVYTSSMGMEPHSSSTAFFHLSIRLKLSRSVVENAITQADAPL